MSEERRLAPASAVSAAREMQDQVEPQKLRVVEVDDVRSAREKHPEKPNPTDHRPPKPANLLRNRRQPKTLDSESRLGRGRRADDLHIVARVGQAPRLAVEDANVTDWMDGRGDCATGIPAYRQIHLPWADLWTRTLALRAHGLPCWSRPPPTALSPSPRDRHRALEESARERAGHGCKHGAGSTRVFNQNTSPITHPRRAFRVATTPQRISCIG